MGYATERAQWWQGNACIAHRRCSRLLDVLTLAKGTLGIPSPANTFKFGFSYAKEINLPHNRNMLEPTPRFIFQCEISGLVASYQDQGHYNITYEEYHFCPFLVLEEQKCNLANTRIIHKGLWKKSKLEDTQTKHRGDNARFQKTESNLRSERQTQGHTCSSTLFEIRIREQGATGCGSGAGKTWRRLRKQPRGLQRRRQRYL